MDVTKENFVSILSKFQEYLQTCDFIALDEEMTGMSLKDVDESCFDSLDESYEKKRQISSAFMLMQVGVCLFQKSAMGKYTVRPFNFFTFPSSDASFRRLVRPITLEAGACAFHQRNNMDFQKWIYQGVGYCNAREEKLYCEHLEQHLKLEQPRIDLRADDLEKARGITAFIGKWASDENRTRELSLPQTDSRIIRRFVEAELPAIAPGHECSWRGRQWVVVPKKAVDLDQVKEERRLTFSGIREVFKLLVESRKPIVGHNCLVDLFFLIDGLDRPIPPSIPEFQSYMSQHFPSVWDTKVLASADPAIEGNFRFTGLQHIFEFYLENPVLTDAELRDKAAAGKKKSARDAILNEVALECMEFPLGFERYSVLLKKRRRSGSNKHSLAHEAAYDALCTGYIFLQLQASLKQETLDLCHNHVAVYKNYNALNTSVGGPPCKKICAGPVLRLRYTESHEAQVEASISPLQGRVEWRENGSAVAVLNCCHTAEEGLKHYAQRDDDITAEEFL